METKNDNDSYTYNGDVRVPYYNKDTSSLSFIEKGETYPRYVMLGRLFGAMNEHILNRVAFANQLKEDELDFDSFKKELNSRLELEFFKLVKELSDVELKVFLGIMIKRGKPDIDNNKFEYYEKKVFKNIQYIDYKILNSDENLDNSLYWKTKDLVNYMYVTVDLEQTVNPDGYSFVLDDRLRLLPKVLKIRPDLGSIAPLTIDDLSGGTGSYMMAQTNLVMDAPFIEKIMSETYINLVKEAQKLDPKVLGQLLQSISQGDLRVDFSSFHGAINKAFNNWPETKKEDVLVKCFEDFMNNRTQIYETYTLGSVLIMAELNGLKVFNKINKDVLTQNLLRVEDVGNGYSAVTLDLVTQAKILLLNNLRSIVYPDGKDHDIFGEIMGFSIEKKSNILFKNESRSIRKFLQDAQGEILGEKNRKTPVFGSRVESLYNKLGNVQEMMFQEISHIINSELNKNAFQPSLLYKMYEDESGKSFVGKRIICANEVAPFIKEALWESLFTTKETWQDNLKIRCADFLMRQDLDKEALIVKKIVKSPRKF